MESRQERMEKRQERIERMLERMERNLERIERRLESIEKTQSRIERQTADLAFDDSSDYMYGSDDEGVSIGGIGASVGSSGAFDPRRPGRHRPYRSRRLYEDDGSTTPIHHGGRPYSMSAAPSRYPPEVFYTSSDRPARLVPGYGRQEYEPDEVPTTIIIDNKTSDYPERSSRSRRTHYRSHYRGRRHGSDEEEEVKKKSREHSTYAAQAPSEPQDRWRSVKPNPDPKPDIIRPSTVRGDPSLLDDDDDY